MEKLSQYLKWIEIDIDALVQNIQALRSQLRQGVKFMAVVKKNAYGHGAPEVCQHALEAGVDSLAVYSLEEALELREAGIDAPVLILGPVSSSAADIVVRQRLIATVIERELAHALSKAAKEQKIVAEVHVIIDTGINRFGVSLEEAPQFLSYLGELTNLNVAGLYTHFSSADETDHTPTRIQLEKFLDLARRFPHITTLHAANSAATLQFPETHLNMVRVGISIYGFYPSNAVRKSVSLRPVLSLKTRVIRLYSIKEGEGLSYGLTWVAPRDSLIALIPFGYGDGLPRLLSNKGEVLIGGRRAPIRGVVCMDQSIIDVTGIPDVRVGDEVTIIGRQGSEEITAGDIAELTGTIHHEVVTRLSGVLPRLYLRTSQPETCRAV
ncbi:MAG: alanine racemase [Dehalococcoidales bacterium]|nr:alanine racemase [Dehalococcoidales bacterium]